MKKGLTAWLAVSFCVIGALSLSVKAQTGERTYAQHLVDEAIKQHPEVVVLVMHATPPGSTENVIIASNIGRLGKKADEGDLAVIKTGKLRTDLHATGDRFEVELPLQDVSRNTLGALAVVYAYKPGVNKAQLQKKAEQVRNEIGRRITNVGNLIEPYPYDPKFSSNTYAQHLVEEALARHPETLVIVLHVTPPESAENLIVASTIGRIGKKADEGDLGVLKTGETRWEVNPEGDRFEVELSLHDVARNPIGVLAVVYQYKNGADKSKLQQQAEVVRDEIGRRITNLANLLEPYPFDPLFPPNKYAHTYAQKLVDEIVAKHPEALLVALHVTPPNSPNNVIIASNFGRVGKKGGPDMLAILDADETKEEINAKAGRISLYPALRDASGKKIGRLGVIFPYKPGDDKAIFYKTANQIRDDLRKRIPSVAKLVEATY